MDELSLTETVDLEDIDILTKASGVELAQRGDCARKALAEGLAVKNGHHGRRGAHRRHTKRRSEGSGGVDEGEHRRLLRDLWSDRGGRGKKPESSKQLLGDFPRIRASLSSNYPLPLPS
eukprot:scaffold222845_cov23-Tisochrysis_lutea.AAC.1